jgi:hypothetical protein
MKDIKELIYAAVEENALKFQELVNNQLQVRAYDAIESLRPEIGASMFGEAKKMKDDEDEEDEDEEDEDEDEDEVKESVREYLNQKGTGKSAEGYDDAGTFDRQTAEKHAAKHGGKLVPDPSGKHLVKLPGKNKKMQEATHPKSKKEKDLAALADPKDKITHKDVLVGRGVVKTEEVEQIDEIGDTPGGKAALTNLASQRLGRARWAAGVHRATSRSDGGATPHSRLQDKDNTVAHKAAAKVGIKPHEVPDHNYDYDKKGGYGTKVADPAHKLAARNTPKKADVQEVAMPKNAADWQAMINHQIQIAGHPVATDAQFRATTVGKDMSKIASLEPGEDMLQYATAQGGTVKK